jgi:hypothetical protein
MISSVLAGLSLVVFAFGWAWLALVGIPDIVQGVQEVREHWDDDSYWDDELHTLLVEDQEPLDTWSFLDTRVFETLPDWEN